MVDRKQNADVVMGLYLGSFVAIVGQLAFGILLLPACVWLVNRPRPYLAGFIFALILSGVYTLDHSLFHVGFALAMGLVGYLMRRAGFPFLPLILGVVLGHMVESSYRRSLVLSGGDHRIFLEDPIAVGLLLVSFGFIVFSLGRDLRDARRARRAGPAQTPS